MERAGHRIQGVVGVRELVRLGNAAEAVGGGNEQPVVGADVQASFGVA